MVLPAMYCLGICLSAAATATARSEISRSGVAIVGQVHVGVVFAAAVLLTSLVRSAT